MTIFAFVNQKGGCAKSTTTCHFAYWLYKQGLSVLVIDADAQQSASKWIDRLGLSAEIRVIPCPEPEDLVQKIGLFVEEFDHILIDGAAGISDKIRTVMLVSDVLIVPIQPTGLDTESGKQALSVVAGAQKIRKGEPRCLILLSRVLKTSVLFGEAITLFSSPEMQAIAQYELLRSAISQRQAVADCFGQGSVIWTMPTDAAVKKARQEFEDLFQEISGLV